MLSAKQFLALQQLSTCAASNAIETLGNRLRNEGFANSSIRCLFPHFPPVLGYAVTIKIRCSSPPPSGPTYLERTQWWDRILQIPKPRIVVIEDVDPKPGTGALVGEVHANILRALDCIGVVTNGAVRDLPVVEKLGFHLFAGSVAVSHAYAHLVEMGTPVEVGGLKVQPGELILGDCHGVLSIPIDGAAEIPKIAEQQRCNEERLIELCRASSFSIEELRSVVRELRNQAS